MRSLLFVGYHAKGSVFGKTDSLPLLSKIDVALLSFVVE